MSEVATSKEVVRARHPFQLRRRKMRSAVLVAFAVLAALMATSAGSAGAMTACPTDSEVGYVVDSDGDGWGWVLNNPSNPGLGGSSCQVVTSSPPPTPAPAPSPTTPDPGPSGSGEARIVKQPSGAAWLVTDSIFNWAGSCDDSRSPQIRDLLNGDTETETWDQLNTRTKTNLSCVQLEATYFGGGVVTSPPATPTPPTPSPTPPPSSGSCPAPQDNNIVVLFAGQSNSINEETTANGPTDGAYSAGFVCVLPAGASNFQPADLCRQQWFAGLSHPANGIGSGGDGVDDSSVCGNNAGFQMAKNIAARTNSTVYLIPTAEDGAAIEDWISGSNGEEQFDFEPNCLSDVAPGMAFREPASNGKTNYDGMSNLRNRVNAGLSSNVGIDVVGWVQGEANSHASDPQAAVPWNKEGMHQYRCKLRDLIHTLDNQVSQIDFGPSGTKFIATEIKDSQNGQRDIGLELVNEAIVNLRSDSRVFSESNNSQWYGQISASDLGVVSDLVHFNSAATTTMGQRLGNTFCSLDSSC